MLISNEKHYVPDDCPTGCPYKMEFLMIPFKSYCYTCPVLLCGITHVMKREDFPVINSIAWFHFFEGGMKVSPDLYIENLKKHSNFYDSGWI